MKSLIPLIIVALLALTQVGCVVNGRRIELTPEQAALHVEPPRKGEQRFQVVKPAAEGALVVFENVADPPREPDWFKIGAVHVTRESFGWAVHESATIGSFSRHGMLLATTSPHLPESYTILFGKMLDGRVNRVLASFSSGRQVQDAVADSLFGIMVAPKTTLCRLELMDAQGKRIELLDLDEVGGDLEGLLDGPVGLARQECKLAGENAR